MAPNGSKNVLKRWINKWSNTCQSIFLITKYGQENENKLFEGTARWCEWNHYQLKIDAITSRLAPVYLWIIIYLFWKPSLSTRFTSKRHMSDPNRGNARCFLKRTRLIISFVIYKDMHQACLKSWRANTANMNTWSSFTFYKQWHCVSVLL